MNSVYLLNLLKKPPDSIHDSPFDKVLEARLKILSLTINPSFERSH
jgi:hypothetical protein